VGVSLLAMTSGQATRIMLETASSFIAGKPCSYRISGIPVGVSLLAMTSGQATWILRPSTVVQRSESITPPSVNIPPTR